MYSPRSGSVKLPFPASFQCVKRDNLWPLFCRVMDQDIALIYTRNNKIFSIYICGYSRQRCRRKTINSCCYVFSFET